MARKLNDIPKKEIFKVPEDYFTELEKKIDRRIDAKPAGKVVSFYSEHRYELAGLAAAAAIALLVIFVPWQNSGPAPDVTAMIAEIPAEDCLAYLEYSDLTIEQIIGSATEQELEEALGDFVPAPQIDDEDLDRLYEKFGATSDEKLKSL